MLRSGDSTVVRLSHFSESSRWPWLDKGRDLKTLYGRRRQRRVHRRASDVPRMYARNASES